MKKIYLYTLCIIALAMTQSCKTPHKTSERKSNTFITDETFEEDTTKIHRVVVTTYEQRPDGGFVKTEDTKEMISGNKRRRNNTQQHATNKKTETDNITPTLYNIDRKMKKDSLKYKLKEKNQETKLAKVIHNYHHVWLVVFTGLLICLWLLYNKKR